MPSRMKKQKISPPALKADQRQHPPRLIRTTTSRNRLFAYPTCRPIPSIGSAATKPGFGARPVRSCLHCSAWIDEIHGKGRDCVEVIPRTGYSKVLEKWILGRVIISRRCPPCPQKQTSQKREEKIRRGIGSVPTAFAFAAHRRLAGRTSCSCAPFDATRRLRKCQH